MIERLDNVKLSIFESEDKLLAVARKKCGGRLKYFKILKKSLDARNKNNIFWVYSIAFSKNEESEIAPPPEKIKNPQKVAVIGSGPAGLFCAIRLIERGFQPVIIERGEPVEARKRTIQSFFDGGKLNENSNVQFGEGGAGAFSDGKLNTGTHSSLNAEVLKIFNRFGAPEEILYLSKPHIGSDKLYGTLQNMRKFIEENGGEYRFNTEFTGVMARGGRLCGLKLKNLQSGESEELEIDCAVLAPGHSARDTFKILHGQGIAMEARDFAIGVRIEHLARKIGFAQYGKHFDKLPAADYKLVSHASERTVFTFCMCPGGVVIPAASEEGGVVTNGMSLFARDGENSNAALMVQLRRADFGEGLFDGMNFLREVEKRAFAVGGNNYRAPVQRFADFAEKKISSAFGEVLPTYAAGTSFALLDDALPETVCGALRAAIPDMGRRLQGFDSGDALLTGVETRFSSPVRILRGESGESISLAGLYPCGEGSGYSGGITSSAADGLETAEKIYQIVGNNH